MVLLPYQAWEKAELHLHLEGAISPETLAELAPGLTPEEVHSHYTHQGFLGFLDNFKRANQKLRTPENYALIARRCLEDLARQNIRYAEVMISAGVVIWKSQDLAAVFDAIAREAAHSAVTIRWILDAVRQLPVEDAWKVVELAVARRHQGVVAFGLGGDEMRGPAQRFREVCRYAVQHGLHLSLHAGENAGPESIWGALEVGAERIGHGFRAVEDPVLVSHLAARGIPLEVCLSSNVATGVVASFREHPARRLHDAGVPLVLNTDDPSFFHTTLAAELSLAETELGFGVEDLKTLVRNGFDFAFDREAAWNSVQGGLRDVAG